MLATTLGADPSYVIAHPETLAAPLLLVLCAAAYVSPLVASDVRHRADSTLDQLTGLLNRRALDLRFAEVSEQAALTAQPVSVVLADLDHFKSINDEHGHARRRRRAARRRLRPAPQPAHASSCSTASAARSSLLLLPGAAEETRRGSPQTLRAAVEELETAGLRSLLVRRGHRARRGDRARSLVARADAALYAAKRHGRNRVERADADALAIA